MDTATTTHSDPGTLYRGHDDILPTRLILAEIVHGKVASNDSQTAYALRLELQTLFKRSVVWPHHYANFMNHIGRYSLHYYGWP